MHVYTKLKHRLPGESRLRIVLGRLRMLARLRSEPFDFVVLAKAGFDRQGLGFARQLKRRHVIGFAEPGAAAPPVITIPVPGGKHSALHEVEVMQLLAQAMDVQDARGPLRVYPPRDRVEAWRTRLPALAARRSRLWVGVHISARETTRHWPVSHWIELITRLCATADTGIVLLWAPGSADDPRHPGDDEKAEEILRQAGRASILPAATCSLSDLIAVLSLCDAFIGADGGAAHIAAALRLPMVALFENLEGKKRRWYPWRVPYELVAPATRDISDITVEQVLHAWQRLAPERRP